MRSVEHGQNGQSIGMVLCLVLAVLSQMYSNEINDLFNIDVSNAVDTSAPLVGLQTNESWFVVLVDFESNQLNNDAKEQINLNFKSILESILPGARSRSDCEHHHTR